MSRQAGSRPDQDSFHAASRRLANTQSQTQTARTESRMGYMGDREEIWAADTERDIEGKQRTKISGWPHRSGGSGSSWGD